MKILVTGATGFVGSHLVPRLCDQHEVFALGREPHRIASNARVSVVTMDLARQFNAKILPAQVDVIIHLAQANLPFPHAANELFAVNTGAVQQLLHYGLKAGALQFVLASTGDVYGRRFGLRKEPDAAQPASYYAVTKYVSESLVNAYSSYLFPCVLRLYQPYGPGQTNRLIPGLAEHILNGRAVRLHRRDRPLMTPIYIDDVTLAIKRVIDLSFSGTINIAGDLVVSMRELAEEIGRLLERKPVFENTEEESTDMMGDNSLMKLALGEWNMVALTEGLSRTFKGEGDDGWQAHR